MLRYYKIIISNLKEYLRSSSFLTIVGLNIFIACTFIPAENASYSTVRFGNFLGLYNSAWIGYVIAIMAGVFLPFFGFFLISSSVKKDIETKVGLIIGATSISNLGYLFCKALANFVILIILSMLVFMTGILLFLFHADGQSFEFQHFFNPFILLVLPSIVLIAFLAVITEVLFKQNNIIQYLGFIMFFLFLLFQNDENIGVNFSDVLGIKFTTKQMEVKIKEINELEKATISIGYSSVTKKNDKKLVFSGLEFPPKFFFLRFIWLIVGPVLLFFMAFAFNRFQNEHARNKQKERQLFFPRISENKKTAIPLIMLLNFKLGTSIIITEIAMMLRNSSVVNSITILGSFLLMVMPLETAHILILPLLWFAHINNWSLLVTKDEIYRTFYFSETAFKPLNRLFLGRVIAGVIFACILASPLLIRYLINDPFQMVNIFLGAIFVVLLAVFLGTLTNSPKLFQISFILLMIGNINKTRILDYYGGMHASYIHWLIMAILCTLLFFGSFSIKKYKQEYK
jgi:hypothetical protein